VLTVAVPAGSRFKGYQDILVRDLHLSAEVIRFRRERWVMPSGETVVAPSAPRSRVRRSCRCCGRGPRAPLASGHADYFVNAAALEYLRGHGLLGQVVAQLDAHPAKVFADTSAWAAHLARLDIDTLAVTPDPVQIASEGALRGAVCLWAVERSRDRVRRRWPADLVQQAAIKA